MKAETKSIHAGHQVDVATGAITPPIHLSTTFERDADGGFSRQFEYARNNNPNRQELEARLTALEGGSDALAFASGSVATMSLFQTLTTGDHVLVPKSVYYNIQVMLRDIFSAWGLQYTLADMTNLDAVREALQANTRLILIETPSNPLLQITDIAGVATIAQEAGALLACDNTIGTAIFQQPLQHGADFVIHSTTKYIGGHTDVISGIVIAKEDNKLFERLRMIQKVGGAIPSPFDCWLVLRGLLSLTQRVRAHADNALQVARWLSEHPKIERVLYPGLASHPGHDIAAQQMSGGYGGLMSCLVQGDAAEALKVAANLHIIKRATSFGGPHSLIEHRASIEDPGTGTPQNLLRLSVGLEHPDDLIADLQQALSTL